jgi:hypothetical protein
MSENANPLPYTLTEEEKVVPVMAYTRHALYWGDVVVKHIVRVSTWLRSGNAPDSIRIFNARVLMTSGISTPKPIASPEMYLNVSEILAFHIRPPAHDPPDYDPNEQNRIMEPVMVLIGNFKIDGSIRHSAKADLAKFIEVTRELFTGIYDAEISCPIISTVGITKVPFLIVRQMATTFSVRTPV